MNEVVRNLFIAIAVFVVALFLISISRQATSTPEPKSQLTEYTYRNAYVDGCMQGGEEYAQTEGFRSYCGCTFDAFAKDAGGFRNVVSYVKGLTEEERYSVYSGCFHHLT